jgi:hypothetical protein
MMDAASKERLCGKKLQIDIRQLTKKVRAPAGARRDAAESARRLPAALAPVCSPEANAAFEAVDTSARRRVARHRRRCLPPLPAAAAAAAHPAPLWRPPLCCCRPQASCLR